RLGAHIDASSRLVEDEHFGRSRKPPRKQHLLLVSAGKVLDDHVRVGGVYPQCRHVLLDDLIEILGGNSPPRAAGGLDGKCDVLAHGEVTDDSLLLAILGREGDATLDRAQRVPAAGRMPIAAEGADIRSIRTVEQAGRFGTSGTEETCKANDL